MNTTDGTLKTPSQTTTESTQPVLGTGVPAVNYAIALQQYHFQQSLISQQLLAQQQAVAHAVSIKAATQQAAVRAAEISKLLNSENNIPKEKVDEPGSRREELESKSHLRSPSFSRSSKSKSVSPTRHRNHKEHERYSPRDNRSYRSSRHSGYYHSHGYGDLMDHSRRSYRGEIDRYHVRRYSYPHRSRGSYSFRYRHTESHSPKHHRAGSPSEAPRPASRRVLNRRSMSRSPIDRSSISSSPKTLAARRSLSPSEQNQSSSTSSPSMEGRRVRHDETGTEKSNASDIDFRQKEIASIPRKQQRENNHSNPSTRSISTSVDYSSKKTTSELRHRKVVASKLASADKDCSDPSSSDEGSVHRMMVAGYADSMKNPTKILDHRRSNHEHVNKSHGEMGPIEGQGLKLHDSMGRSTNRQHHMKLNSCSSSLENTPDSGRSKLKSTPEHKTKSKASSRNEVKSYHSPDPKIDDGKMKEKMDYGNCSEEVTTAEHVVNDCSHHTEQGVAPRHDIGAFEVSIISGEYTINHNLPKPNSVDGKFMLHESANEDIHVVGNVAETTPILSDEHVSEIPIVYQYPQEKPKRSQSRERRRKERRKHQKKRRRDYSEEEEEDDDHYDDDNHERESHSKSKLKRHGKKSRHHRKHRKSCREKKRSKHREMYSSSSEDSSSCSDENGKERNIDSGKTTTGNRKKRSRHSSTSSSDK